MRLDAGTAEIVHCLNCRGYRVVHPVDAALDDEQARIALSSGHYAIVTRNEQGRLTVEMEDRPPARLSIRVVPKRAALATAESTVMRLRAELALLEEQTANKRAELEAALDKRDTCHVAALNAAIYALEARSK